MRGLFTPQQLKEINDIISRRMRQRMGMEQKVDSKLMSRKDGLAVSEGICPKCRKEMHRIGKVGKEIHWSCQPCEVVYRIVDPRDEINKLTGGK